MPAKALLPPRLGKRVLDGLFDSKSPRHAPIGCRAGSVEKKAAGCPAAKSGRKRPRRRATHRGAMLRCNKILLHCIIFKLCLYAIKRRETAATKWRLFTFLCLPLLRRRPGAELRERSRPSARVAMTSGSRRKCSMRVCFGTSPLACMS